MNFDNIAKNAGLPLLNGELSGIGRAFCFFPKTERVKTEVGQALMGTVTGIQRLENNDIVVQISTPNVLPGKTVALRYFEFDGQDTFMAGQMRPGWYLQVIDNRNTANIAYREGRLKWL